MSVRPLDHTGLWLLSVAELIAKVWTFAADFYSQESPAEPMASNPSQKLRFLQWLAELHFLFGCSPEPKLAIVSETEIGVRGRWRIGGRIFWTGKVARNRLPIGVPQSARLWDGGQRIPA
jgi:hypothetical protein